MKFQINFPRSIETKTKRITYNFCAKCSLPSFAKSCYVSQLNKHEIPFRKKGKRRRKKEWYKRNDGKSTLRSQQPFKSISSNTGNARGVHLINVDRGEKKKETKGEKEVQEREREREREEERKNGRKTSFRLNIVETITRHNDVWDCNQLIMAARRWPR